MQISDWINVVLCVLSFFLAVISVVTVVITLRQNQKMIENSTRPYIAISYETICVAPNKNNRYIVVKNYGQSAAEIKDVSCIGLQSTLLLHQFNLLKNSCLASDAQTDIRFASRETGHHEPRLLHLLKTPLHYLTCL